MASWPRPTAAHMAMYDDQPTYFAKLTAFLRKFR